MTEDSDCGWWVAIQLPNGKYLSRGRFHPDWDGAFEVDRPELWPYANPDHEHIFNVARQYGGSLVHYMTGSHSKSVGEK
jgi:hypothetical protein